MLRMTGGGGRGGEYPATQDTLRPPEVIRRWGGGRRTESETRDKTASVEQRGRDELCHYLEIRECSKRYRAGAA